MMAIALGVLLLTAAVTAGLARRSEVTSARNDVRTTAGSVVYQNAGIDARKNEP